ncbi:MAG: hypothetical protein WDM87_10670 [Terracidiphilus sp.]
MAVSQLHLSETVPVDIAAGDVLTVSVVIQNKGIGHTLVPEQRDFYECWVEFQAKDAAGNTADGTLAR